jgi:hypothetical protein
MNIKSFTLTIYYDTYIKDADRQTLRIAAEPEMVSPDWPKDLAPYFLVDTPDVSGRKDGTGDFYRIYHRNATVHVTAPATFGYWRFKQWITPGGGTDTNMAQEISFDQDPSPYRNDQVWYAQYEYEGPILNLADFNLDYGVDLKDFSALAGVWRTTPSDQAKWDAVYDISNPPDAIIDLWDLVVFCENWLEN